MYLLRSGFNPRARAGRDHLQQFRLLDAGVSIHAPARGATPSRPPRRPAEWCFNPRARAGRDNANRERNVSARTFQSTRPRGARPFRTSRRDRRCFNPRARAGRDVRRQPGAAHGDVSIHAPARGATSRACRRRCSTARFNPRARAGRDQRHHAGLLALLAVSIHAPARGATWTVQDWRYGAKVSIHAPARGATCGITEVQAIANKFQSTRPRGA